MKLQPKGRALLKTTTQKLIGKADWNYRSMTSFTALEGQYVWTLAKMQDDPVNKSSLNELRSTNLWHNVRSNTVVGGQLYSTRASNRLSTGRQTLVVTQRTMQKHQQCKAPDSPLCNVPGCHSRIKKKRKGKQRNPWINSWAFTRPEPARAMRKY